MQQSITSPSNENLNFLGDLSSDVKQITTATTATSTSSSFSYCSSSIKKYHEWNCNVTVYDELLSTEFLAITGNCNELGNWKPNSCIPLKLNCQKGITTNQWNKKIQIPYNQIIEYRYFIGMINSNNNTIIIRRWETHLQPRIIQINDSNGSNNNEVNENIKDDKKQNQIIETFDIFGIINDIKCIHRGWLTNEIILQLKIYNKPFEWHNNNELYDNIHIKITSMQIKNNGDMQPIFIPNTKAIIEYVKFDYGSSLIKLQKNEYGIDWKQDDIIIFHITVCDLTNIAYLIEIFGNEKGKKLNDNDSDCNNVNVKSNKFLKHLGYYYLLSDAFKHSDGNLKLSITNTIDHQILGILNISYLIIKPLLPNLNMNLRTTSMTLWKSNWIGLDIGHRGNGVSFRIASSSSSSETLYPENTIASLKKAALNGADMLEFDVHITKDGIPIVYHDYHVNILSNTTISSYPKYGSDLIPILIKDLTYDELKNLKTYHLNDDGIIHQTPNFHNLNNESNLFPKLEDIFDNIDNNIGLDIEIKWPQQLIDGTWESQQTIDKNLFVNSILKIILNKGYGRLIVISCFDADICIMLRFKQNIYPILFLTLGLTKRYPLYMDPRCNSIKMATCLVQSMEFLGLIPHTEDILYNPKQLELCKNLKQIIFCWGDDSNCKENIEKLKSYGLNGVIYDRIDKILNMKNKKKIFSESFNKNCNCKNKNNNASPNRSKNNYCCNEFFKYQFIENDDNNYGNFDKKHF